MTAPKTLTVYLKHPTADDVYYIRGSWAPAAITARDKRFSEAELAAEWWSEGERIRWAELMMAEWEASGVRLSVKDEKWRYWFRNKRQSARRQNTIHRFATLPHHDQEQP